MGDLYTSFMEKIMPYLIAHWQLFIMFVGLLFLLGAVFRWKWICDPNGERINSFNAFVYRAFGEKGYRVLMGVSGSAIILCGAVMWVLM